MRRAAELGVARCAVLLAALVVSACGGDDAEPAGQATPPSAPAILEAAATRMQQVQRFHFVLEHENGTTEIVRGVRMTRAEGDVDGADKLRVAIKGSFANVNLDTGIVILGKDAWFQNPLTRRWERESISVDDVFDPQNGVLALVRSAAQKSPRLAGTEELDGVRVYRIEATLDSGELVLLPGVPPRGRAIPAVAWIGVADPLVRKVELRGGVSPGEADNLVRRLVLSRFGEDPKIEPPR